MSARRWAGTSQHVRMAAASTASGTRCWPSSSSYLPIGFWKRATESRELDAGFRVVGRLHVTLKRLPPPPGGGGRRFTFKRLPLPPVEGGGAASFGRRPVAIAACVNRDRVRVAVRSQA